MFESKFLFNLLFEFNINKLFKISIILFNKG